MVSSECSPESYSHPFPSFAVSRSPKFLTTPTQPHRHSFPGADAVVACADQALGLLLPLPLQRRATQRPPAGEDELGELVKAPCSYAVPTNQCACVVR